MFQLSLSECIIIGLVAIFCGFICQIMINYLAEEEIKESNIITKLSKHLWFYVLLFLIGVSIHIFVSYLDFNNWSCEKVCDKDLCNIICTIPINKLTSLLLLK